MLPYDQIFVHKVLLESCIDLPARNIEHISSVLAILLEMASNVLHALFPARWASELLVAARERTDGLLWCVAELQIAARLVLLDVVLVDRVFLHVTSARPVCGVHAAKVLCEEVFAVEIIVVQRQSIVRVRSRRAEIAAPIAEFNMLGTDMTFPFVLRREG